MTGARAEGQADRCRVRPGLVGGLPPARIVGAAVASGSAADLAWRRQGPGVQVLEGNLRRVIGSAAPGGELRALSRQVMRSYARYWLEAFRLPVMRTGRLLGGMHVPGISGPHSNTSRPAAG